MSNAAHPGVARTELASNGFGPSNIMTILMNVLGPIAFQSAANGALPILYAATASEAVNGGYYGPSGFMEIKGAPTVAKIGKAAQDPIVASKLWDHAVRLTGVDFG